MVIEVAKLLLSIFQGYVHLQQGITICLLTTNEGQVLRTYQAEPSLNLISTRTNKGRPWI